MQQAFVDAGYDASFGRVSVSNRPDLCEYQCNGALAAAKTYKCAPIQIAKAVAEKLDAADYSMVDAVMPGFINLKLSDTSCRITWSKCELPRLSALSNPVRARPSWWTTADPMLPSLCTSATCAPPSSARA